MFYKMPCNLASRHPNPAHGVCGLRRFSWKHAYLDCGREARCERSYRFPQAGQIYAYHRMHESGSFAAALQLRSASHTRWALRFAITGSPRIEAVDCCQMRGIFYALSKSI